MGKSDEGLARHGEGSDLDLCGRAGSDGEVDDPGGDGEVLKADAGPVEESDFLGRGAAGMDAFDHRAELGDGGRVDQAGGDGVLGLADRDRLGRLVGEESGAGQQCRLDLLLALGVGAHAGEMRAGPDLRRLQDRGEGGGDGDDDVGLGPELVEIDRLEGQAVLGGDASEPVEPGGVAVPGDDLLEGPLAQGGAQLEAGLVAGADDTEDAGVGPGEIADRDGRGGGGARGGQVVAADQGGGPAGIGVEQEDGRLVVGDPANREIVGPVAAGLEAEDRAGPVEPTLNP